MSIRHRISRGVNPERCDELSDMNLWAHTLVELWAWDKPEEELVDRSASPWDAPWRRPSHADRRKAMLRETLRAEIQAAASGDGQTEKLKALAERLLLLAA